MHRQIRNKQKKTCYKIDLKIISQGLKFLEMMVQFDERYKQSFKS